MQPIKVLQQDLCRVQLSWDDTTDEQSQKRLDELLSDLPKLAAFKVPRCLKPTNFGNVSMIELHHFSDASEQAYGRISYVRLINEGFNRHCSIVLAACRLTPIQRVTVPRLELNAATLLTKHDQVLRRELRLNQVASLFWTDNTIVLRYIRNESRAFKNFVANRVALIRGNSNVSQWRFVTGRVNPADMITRGVTASELLKCTIWLRGPQFLTNSTPWPKQPDFLESELDSDLEIRSVKVCLVKTPPYVTVDHLFSRFSSWNKLKITVEWLLRHRHNLQRHRTERARHKFIEPLCVEELQEAELQILKYLQRKHYIDELQELMYGKQLKQKNKLANLDPFLHDDGIIRAGRRLASAPIAFGSKHRILVPHASAVASLLIFHFHCVSGHAGRSYVLSAVREKF